jgi:hypothetical protein
MVFTTRFASGRTGRTSRNGLETLKHFSPSPQRAFRRAAGQASSLEAPALRFTLDNTRISDARDGTYDSISMCG